MGFARWLVLGFTLGLILSVAPSCGGGEPCGPGSCYGCCNSQGICVAGNSAAVCGIDGTSCQSCGTGQSCAVGVCTAGQAQQPPADAGSNGGEDAGVDAGESFPTNPLQMTAVITPNPPRLGTNTVKVTLRGANGVLVPNATMTAKTWMPAMGHGSGTPTVTNLGNGDYQVSGVSFTMYGTWTLTCSATAYNGVMVGNHVFEFTVN